MYYDVKYITKYNKSYRRNVNYVVHTNTIKLLLNNKYTCEAYCLGERVTDLNVLDELCREIKGE